MSAGHSMVPGTIVVVPGRKRCPFAVGPEGWRGLCCAWEGGLAAGCSDWAD